MQTVLDIETYPALVLMYGSHFEPVIAKELESTKIISISYCHGDGPVKFKAIWDFPDYKPGKYSVDDKSLVKFIAKEILEKSTIVCGHNSDNFDVRTIQERMHYHKIKPTSTFKTWDTLKLYRKYFKNPTNKLAYISEKYGSEGKIGHEGMNTYILAALGDEKHQRTLKKYNIRDTEVTRERLKAVMEWENRAKPVWDKRPPCDCGGAMTISKKRKHAGGKVFIQYQCKECGDYKTAQQVIERV